MTNHGMILGWNMAISESQTKYNGMSNHVFVAELF